MKTDFAPDLIVSRQRCERAAELQLITASLCIFRYKVIINRYLVKLFNLCAVYSDKPIKH